MDRKKLLKQVLIATAVLHLVEAVFARRRAKKVGKNPNLYFMLTLVFGFLASRRLKKNNEPAA